MPDDAPTVAARPRRRAVRVGVRVAVFVVIGAVVTVVVAWTCALYGDAIHDDETLLLQAAESPRIQALPETHSIAPYSIGVSRSLGMTLVTVDGRTTAWEGHATVQFVEAGWPALALAGEKTVIARAGGGTRSNAASVRYRSAIALPGSLMAVADNTADALPVRPILGFAVDTLLYASLAWLLWFSPGMTRQAIRRRRNRCPACNYPVGPSDRCTECGGAVRQVSALVADAVYATRTRSPFLALVSLRRYGHLGLSEGELALASN